MVKPDGWSALEELERLQDRPTEAEIEAEFKRRKGVVDLDPDVILWAFKRARRRALTAVLFPIGLVALASTGWLDVFWSGVLAIGSAIAAILLFCHYYVCPQCGEIPMSGWERVGAFSARQYVDLDPARCRKCGARLK